MAQALDRASVFDNAQLAGVALCRAYSELVDNWLRDLFVAEFGAIVSLLLDNGMLTQEEVAARFAEYYKLEIERSRQQLGVLLGIDPTGLVFG